MTDNTKTKRKRTNGKTTIHKILQRKLKIEQHGPHQKKNNKKQNKQTKHKTKQSGGTLR
jgi:hypothetical protein